jgi:hypothetical protein
MKKLLFLIPLVALFTSFKNGDPAKKKLYPGLKSVRGICNSGNDIRKMKLFMRMNGADSVFEAFPIQHRTNTSFTYSCERGYFEKPLTTCQIIDCDNVTTAVLVYVKSKEHPEIDSANHIDVYIMNANHQLEKKAY